MRRCCVSGGTIRTIRMILRRRTMSTTGWAVCGWWLSSPPFEGGVAARPGWLTYTPSPRCAGYSPLTGGELIHDAAGTVEAANSYLYAVRAALRRAGRRDPRQPVEVHRPVAEPVPSRDEGTPKSTNTTSAPANTTRP
jgi:hypothetical protein